LKRIPPFFTALAVGFAVTLLAALLIIRSDEIRKLFHFSQKQNGPRPVELLFLFPVSSGPEIWRSKTDGSSRHQLTHTTGQVLDYSVSPDGQQIAFTVENNEGGSDLWMVDRDGKKQQILVPCGADQCSAASWSPDGQQLAFIRQGAKPDPAGDPGYPRPWLIELSGLQVHLLDNDPLVSALQVRWSPDGQKMALYDPSVKGIRLRSLVDGREVLVETSFPSAGAWSPDSKQLLFSSEENKTGFTLVRVYSMEISSGKTALLLGKEDNDVSDYSLPAWSPDGQWLVFGQRTISGLPSKQLFLIHPDGSGAKSLTNDLTFTHAAYAWSPDGTAVVFQQFPFGASENVPEVALIGLASGELNLVAKDAALPQWLP
jgi:Tol biopolymer transport system component